jgi:hypothetical protein
MVSAFNASGSTGAGVVSDGPCLLWGRLQTQIQREVMSQVCQEQIRSRALIIERLGSFWVYRVSVTVKHLTVNLLVPPSTIYEAPNCARDQLCCDA